MGEAFVIGFIFGMLAGVCLAMLMMDPSRQYIKELEKKKHDKE